MAAAKGARRAQLSCPARINIASDAPDCLTSGAARESVGRVGRGWGLRVAGGNRGWGPLGCLP